MRNTNAIVAWMAITVFCGCAPEEEDAAPGQLDQDLAGCTPEATPADVNAPPFLFYGTYAVSKPNGDGTKTSYQVFGDEMNILTEGILKDDPTREMILAVNNPTAGCMGPTRHLLDHFDPDGPLAPFEKKWVQPATWRLAEPDEGKQRKIAAVFDACQLRHHPQLDQHLEPHHHLTLERAKQVLRSGFAYIAIDELAFQKTYTEDQIPIAQQANQKLASGKTLADLTATERKVVTKCRFNKSEWKNGGMIAERFEELLEGLAAEGLDRRVILYGNTYNLFDQSRKTWTANPSTKPLVVEKGLFAPYSNVLTACRDHCRLFAAEQYVSTKRANGEVAPSKEHCNWNTDCFDSVARHLERAAPGMAGRSITVLGLGQKYNKPDNPRSLCGRHGALSLQYAKLRNGSHTRRQPGIGGYSLADVPLSHDGAPWAKKQAICLSKLHRQADWPRAGGPAHDCSQSFRATIRDFRQSHPDMQVYAGVTPTLGLVDTALTAYHVPYHLSQGPTAMTSGREAFDQWYFDVPGVNRRIDVTLELVDDGTGSWVFDDDAFFPVDGAGFGDEGNAHNYHFTTELRAWFRYEGGEQLTFEGDDDMWLFINGRLALDLGGTHPEDGGTVDFDAMAYELGIQKGGTYPMDVFHAERYLDESHFRIQTTVACLDPPK